MMSTHKTFLLQQGVLLAEQTVIYFIFSNFLQEKLIIHKFNTNLLYFKVKETIIILFTSSFSNAIKQISKLNIIKYSTFPKWKDHSQMCKSESS